MYYHPKYYKELRKQRRDSIEALPRNGESLVPEEAPSPKPQAPSLKLQAASLKPQAASFKLQAASGKLPDPRTPEHLITLHGSWTEGQDQDKCIVRMREMPRNLVWWKSDFLTLRNF